MKAIFNSLLGKVILMLLIFCVQAECVIVAPACAQTKHDRYNVTPRTIKNKSVAGLQVMVNQMESSLKFRVQFEEYSKKNVKVLIMEEKGEIFFVHTFSLERYVGRFDLSGVKDGTYHFVISTNTESYKQSFHIRNISMRMVTKAEDYPPLVQRTKYP